MDEQAKKIRRYSEVILLPTFAERLEYLRLGCGVGVQTFGSSRFINQDFYRLNPLWKQSKREVIIRDLGCDLGIEGLEIDHGIYVHHMNPITVSDIENLTPYALDPEFLICCSHKTHNAIHYGGQIVQNSLVERERNDTCPWR